MPFTDLVRKRHDGDGWIVFSELRSNTDGDRRADAAALGMWRSNGYEMHGYEFKTDRRDLVRELKDGTKTQPVGRYCHYWWLVVSEEALLTDLVVPDAWGILIPRGGGAGRVLRIHRKAPKVKDPRPFDPAFVISMIRNVVKGNGWVPADVHRKVQEELYRLRHPAETDDQDTAAHELARVQAELRELKVQVESFQAASGIDLSERWCGKAIGNAVKIVRDLNLAAPTSTTRGLIHRLSSICDDLVRQATYAAEQAVGLRQLLPEDQRHKTDCPSLKWAGIKCRCGAEPLSDLERDIQAAIEPAT